MTNPTVGNEQTTGEAVQRVKTMLSFEEPDRIPRFFSFWPEFNTAWDERYGPTDLVAHFGNDITVVAADETAWPTRAEILSRDGDETIHRTGWGHTERIKTGTHFSEWIEPAITERVDPDSLVFDDPLLDARYEAAEKSAAAVKDQLFLFGKTGGPYLRAAFMRGEENFWMDVAEDPEWTRAFVDRVADHITQIGVEQVRRFGLSDTGMSIYDDVAASWGPFVGPANYEKIFLPALRRMIAAYKDAGARWVLHHADGNVLPLLDMWIDAGIDAINPVEYRAGMDAVKIRQQYGDKLALIGGLDNCQILPRGDKDEVRDHVLHLLEAGRGGGYAIGPHSIGPDIAVDTMALVLELLEEHGCYPL